MDKAALRNQMSEKRNQLTAEEIKNYSIKITQQVINNNLYNECANICIYQAFRNEVSCEYIMEQALSDGKKVFVPVSDSMSKTMEFYQVTKNTRWKNGAYGIKEPVLEPETGFLKEKAFILMPGLVFDRKRHRIGYGGGYYDKYLSVYREHITAALCYSFQITEENLPWEEHDILPDYIFTEKEWIQ